MGPINPLACHIGALYIIAANEYLKKWVEAAPVKDFTTNMVARFIFENVIIIFGYPRVLMNDE
jgi:hypothetical protein